MDGLKMEVKFKDLLFIYEHQISKNVKNKKKLLNFERNKFQNLINIYYELKNNNYRVEHYNIFLIREPKKRIVMSLSIHDKIINHYVTEFILKPKLEKYLDHRNIATRKNMGSDYGIKLVKKYLEQLKKYDQVYVLKIDISKYFYHIDHEILLHKLRHDIHDLDVIELLEKIITSTDQTYVNQYIDLLIERETKRLQKQKCPDQHRLEELSKIPRYKKGKGLPIGNETSQILAIYYLNSLDHYIKEQLHIKCYVRYMDDFILFHHDKDYLEQCLVKIKKELKSLKLSLNRKTQIYDLEKGFNFLGYKFVLKNKKLLILLNNQTKKKIKKKLRKLKKHQASNYQAVKTSYQGYFQVANTKHFLYRSKF